MQMNNYPLASVFTQMAAQGVTEFLVATEHHAKFLTLSLVGKRSE